jgi:hypothetical protein
MDFSKFSQEKLNFFYEFSSCFVILAVDPRAFSVKTRQKVYAGEKAEMHNSSGSIPSSQAPGGRSVRFRLIQTMDVESPSTERTKKWQQTSNWASPPPAGLSSALRPLWNTGN